MRRLVRPVSFRAYMLGRLAWCGLPVALGAGALLVLMLVMTPPARPASAAAPAAAAATFGFPGCAPTIQACINAAPAGSTVVISAGTYITSLTLSTAVSLTGVNSGTVILQALNNHRVLTVTSAVTPNVVISGITFARGNALGGACPSGCGGAIYLDSGTHPQLTNLKVLSSTAGSTGGGLYAFSAVTLTNVQLISNTAMSNGGGLYAGADLKLVAGLFRANVCTGTCNGGGLYAVAGLRLTGTQFLSNTSVGSGGGANVQLSAVVHDGLFQSNQCSAANCDGGGLNVETNLTLSGTHFVSNTTQANGGGAFGQTAVVTGGLFLGNQCLVQNLSCKGGGLFSNGTVNMTGTQFVSNTSYSDGGGLYAQGVATVNSGYFERNQCQATACNGGGLHGLNTLTMSGTQFVSNTSKSHGGGMFANATARLTGGLFRANQCLLAGCNGGGMVGSTTLIVTGTQFLSNTAAGAGGGLRHNSIAARVQNALFVGNTAANGAGALSLNSPGSMLLLHATIDSGTGAAVELLQGLLLITDTIITHYTIGLSRTAGTMHEGHNLLFGNTFNYQGTISSHGGTLTGQDPLYKNPAAGDYRLSAGSPAEDAGENVGVLTDFEGDARPTGDEVDIGYDERVSHAPTAGGAAYGMSEDTVLPVPAPGLLATGADLDGDPLTALLVSGPAIGTLSLNPNGAFTYTPPLNINGLVTFTYALSDGESSSLPAVASITVSPVNDVPTLSALTSLTVSVDTPISPLPFTVGDMEDAAGALTLTATSSNQALLADGFIGVSGSGANRSLLLVPADGQTGSTLITLTVHDSQDGTASRMFTLTVTDDAEPAHKLYLPLVIFQ